ncbi:MAG: PTS sugar transporter subunit IIA [Clostridiales bacterium]|nr:MAG: PTS sugar transporter subunit IIA [Clostridiales bacterium]
MQFRTEKSLSVKETTVAIGRLKNETEWESVDGKPVKLVVLFGGQRGGQDGCSRKTFIKYGAKACVGGKLQKDFLTQRTRTKLSKFSVNKN